MVFNSHGFEYTVVLDLLEQAIFFLIKKIDAVISNLEKQIWPVLKFFEKKKLSSTYSAGVREYILDNLCSEPETSSIVWSHWQCFKRMLNSFFANTDLKSWV